MEVSVSGEEVAGGWWEMPLSALNHTEGRILPTAMSSPSTLGATTIDGHGDAYDMPVPRRAMKGFQLRSTWPEHTPGQSSDPRNYTRVSLQGHTYPSDLGVFRGNIRESLQRGYQNRQHWRRYIREQHHGVVRCTATFLSRPRASASWA